MVFLKANQSFIRLILCVKKEVIKVIWDDQDPQHLLTDVFLMLTRKHVDDPDLFKCALIQDGDDEDFLLMGAKETLQLNWYATKHSCTLNCHIS